jgi:hypothetical protein
LNKFHKTIDDEAATEAVAITAGAAAITAGPTATSATATTAPGNEAVIGNPRAASYGAAAVAMTAGAATAEAANEAEAEANGISSLFALFYFQNLMFITLKSQYSSIYIRLNKTQ